MKWKLRGIWRTLLHRPCEVCERFSLRCWRWHVETLICPTCGTEVSEYDETRFLGVSEAIPGETVTLELGPLPSGATGWTLNGLPLRWDETARAWVP